jgi:hypothetical protein
LQPKEEEEESDSNIATIAFFGALPQPKNKNEGNGSCRHLFCCVATKPKRR